MGILYILGDLSAVLAFILEIPATIFKTLAIYFYNGAAGSVDNNDATDNEDE